MILRLSPKYKAFLRHEARAEFLEGTTYAGKTTIGLIKFMNRVAASDKRLHILSGLSQSVIERNMIQKEYGVLYFYGKDVQYYGAGNGRVAGAHLLFRTDGGEKVIYILGYDNRSRWKKILGGQYGCVYVDEINVADMDYIREISIRCDYFLATLNPDDPGLPVYREMINHARPLPFWAGETPAVLLAQLDATEKEGWTHWYFSFEHNLGLDQAKREGIRAFAPVNTKLYKNKILGLRGRAAGLVFELEPQHLITRETAKAYEYVFFSCGVDTSYSRRTDDAFAFVFSGFTKCRKKITLAAKTFNNRDLATPLSPSDLPGILTGLLKGWEAAWGLARDVYIDSADQATLMECAKYKRKEGCLYQFIPAYKKLRNLDRIHLQHGWMAKGFFFILEECGALIDEMNAYSWQTDKNEPEDGHDHAINADQYSWMPYKHLIG